MPQMAPLNWLFLFIMTISFFLMINSINYFNFSMTPPNSTIKSLSNKNWKW